jgi:hypothetical protein
MGIVCLAYLPVFISSLPPYLVTPGPSPPPHPGVWQVEEF